MRFKSILFIILILFACTKKTELLVTAAQPEAAMVMTEPVVDKLLFDSILYPARVDAGAEAAVLADTDGLVSRVKTALGRAVRKGDVLMTIENPDPVYKYAPISVTAPVSGVVSFLDASIGNRIERGRKLAIIADVKDVKIHLEATTADLSSLKVGQTGDFTVNGKIRVIKIVAISPFVDPATGTATIELIADKQTKPDADTKAQPEERLVPGLMGRVEFRVRERQGIHVADSSIVYKGIDPNVRVVEANTAHWRKITTGATAGGSTEVLDGLKKGDQIIIRASVFIADGDKVEIQVARKGEVARP